MGDCGPLEIGMGSRVVEVLHGSTWCIGRRISIDERPFISSSYGTFTVNKRYIGKHTGQLCLFLSIDGTTFLTYALIPAGAIAYSMRT